MGWGWAGVVAMVGARLVGLALALAPTPGVFTFPAPTQPISVAFLFGSCLGRMRSREGFAFPVIGCPSRGGPWANLVRPCRGVLSPAVFPPVVAEVGVVGTPA